MVCSQCGNSVDSESRFCAKCGTSLSQKQGENRKGQVDSPDGRWILLIGVLITLVVVGVLISRTGGGSESESEFDRLLSEYQRNWDRAPVDYNIQTCMAWRIYGPSGFRQASSINVSDVEWEALQTLLGNECR